MKAMARSLAAVAVLLLTAGEPAGGAEDRTPATARAGVPGPAVDWRAYFPDIARGAILIRTAARQLVYWSPGGETVARFPVAVARAPELGRTGRTTVVAKRTDPGWTPTPSMRRRDPGLPAHVPPGPENPMGRHALYLGWEYYAIHGTNDPLSVGRATTSGCFRLFPQDVERLFRTVRLGTPVYVE